MSPWDLHETKTWLFLVQRHRLSLKESLIVLSVLVGLAFIPAARAQSEQVARQWALFNEILYIGIVVGIVVFGLLFYAIIRYRERPEKEAAK